MSEIRSVQDYKDFLILFQDMNDIMNQNYLLIPVFFRKKLNM